MTLEQLTAGYQQLNAALVAKLNAQELNDLSVLKARISNIEVTLRAYLDQSGSKDMLALMSSELNQYKQKIDDIAKAIDSRIIKPQELQQNLDIWGDALQNVLAPSVTLHNFLICETNCESAELQDFSFNKPLDINWQNTNSWHSAYRKGTTEMSGSMFRFTLPTSFATKPCVIEIELKINFSVDSLSFSRLEWPSALNISISCLRQTQNFNVSPIKFSMSSFPVLRKVITPSGSYNTYEASFEASIKAIFTVQSVSTLVTSEIVPTVKHTSSTASQLTPRFLRCFARFRFTSVNSSKGVTIS